MKFLAHVWKNWKTRGFGLIMVVLGFLQINAEPLRMWLSPKQYGLLVLSIGLVNVVLGYLNVKEEKPKDKVD